MSNQRLEEIDRNFQLTAASGEGLCWVDAFDADRVALRGLGWLEETRPVRSFRRLPDRAADRLSEGVQSLSRCPTGAFISFFTDSPSINVRVQLGGSGMMRHMPLSGSAGVELYLRNGPQWHPVATGIPTFGEDAYERELITGLPSARREFRLYLPLYQELKELALGFAPGARVEPAPVPPGEKPIFVYGTSVTQGGCANTAGSDFVSHFGRVLDREVINFGFSGNGKGEPEIAELIAEIDAEMFLLNFISNCPPELLEERLLGMIDILRERHPATPIVVVTCPCYDLLLTHRDRYESIMIRRDIALDVYLRKKRAGDRHLHLVEGFGLTPINRTGTYVDGLHPTSGGFIEMGERLAAQIESIRLFERHWIG